MKLSEIMATLRNYSNVNIAVGNIRLQREMNSSLFDPKQTSVAYFINFFEDLVVRLQEHSKTWLTDFRKKIALLFAAENACLSLKIQEQTTNS